MILKVKKKKDFGLAKPPIHLTSLVSNRKSGTLTIFSQTSLPN